MSSKITQLAYQSGITDNDLLTYVDVSDTTMSSSGTNVQIRFDAFKAKVATTGFLSGDLGASGKVVPRSLGTDGRTLQNSPMVINDDGSVLINSSTIFDATNNYLYAGATVYRPNMIMDGTLDNHFDIQSKGFEVVNVETVRRDFTVNNSGQGIQVWNDNNVSYITISHTGNGLISTNSGYVGVYNSNGQGILRSSSLTGVLSTSLLGTGSPTSSTYLRGDGLWSTISAGGGSISGTTGSTDRAILIASGTGGGQLAPSTCTITSSGNIKVMGSGARVQVYDPTLTYQTSMLDDGTNGKLDTNRGSMYVTSANGDIVFGTPSTPSLYVQTSVARLFFTGSISYITMGGTQISYHNNDSANKFQTFIHGNASNPTFKNVAFFGIQGLNADWSQTNGSGHHIVIEGGRCSGSGLGGSVFISTTPSGAGGTTQNTPIPVVQCDANVISSGQTRFMLYDTYTNSFRRVLFGAPDSAGSGYRALCVTN